MSYRVRLTQEAEADLDRLTDFLFAQVDGDWTAVEWALDAIWRGLEQLEYSPFGCRRADEDNAFLRELIISFGHAGYVVLFEIQDARNIAVLALRHQREDDYH